jgi:hypothetical protein
MTIDALKAVIGSRGGVNQPNRFTITFNPPGGGLGGDDITLLCESVSMPGHQISTFDYPFEAVLNSVKVPNGYIYEDVQCTFIITNDYSIKKIFDAWKTSIITEEYRLNYANVYERDIIISSLNQKNEKVYEVTLQNAYPMTVASIELNNGTVNEITKLQVTFTYAQLAQS